MVSHDLVFSKNLPAFHENAFFNYYVFFDIFVNRHFDDLEKDQVLDY